MLGFGKKKKKDAEKDSTPAATPEKPEKGKKAPKKGKGQDDSVTTEPAAAPPPKKKRFSIKKILFVFLVLGAIGAAGFFVYSTYFTEPDPNQRIYTPVALPHVNLPQEMLKFSFDHFPEVYDSLVIFDKEVNLFDREIQRIEAIGAQYPEQKKITDSQKKVWDKGKNTLKKEFLKLEKPIKETYVLFRVNQAQGRTQIQERSKDLSDIAQAALDTAQEQTAPLKALAPKAPEGLLKGTFFNLKKKFL